jgi:hypothetical protein
MKASPCRAGRGELDFGRPEAKASYYERDGEPRFRIDGLASMPPFLISVVGDSDLWLFVSSLGPLTAGRGDPDGALFPYCTDDRIHDSLDLTGSKTILRVHSGGQAYLWEPFSPRYEGSYRITRAISKSAYGHQVEFEESNEELGLSFSYSWTTSPRYGLVREAALRNTGKSAVRVELLDGLLNLMPSGLTRRFYSEFSTLADAYREAELLGAGGGRRSGGGQRSGGAAASLALFRLSALPADKPEPSEALRATTVWSSGLGARATYLCSDALDSFRRGEEAAPEPRLRGRRGAYLERAELELAPGGERSWTTVADVGADAARVVELLAGLAEPEALREEVRRDVAEGLRGLRRIVASSDGLQLTGDRLRSWRHWSNALFNAMRGGVPVEGYAVGREDFASYLADASRAAAARSAAFLASLPQRIGREELASRARAEGDPDLERLAREYLPLTFSRRHGDPSRPWNSFSITPRGPKGERTVGYEGNWRDIFQNWEALALSFPLFLDGMILKFLDASTADGYNPYRITRKGIEWEAVDEHDPWAMIGYWGDHQAAYLLRLLEASERYRPGALAAELGRRTLSYAQVPYRLKPYAAMLEDPKRTVDFDSGLHAAIMKRAAEAGEDGKLLPGPDGRPCRACLAEKLLVALLSKLSSLVPDGGIWMNTQRPEWNDANNALVGQGVSVVTACYLRRLAAFFDSLLAGSKEGSFEIGAEVALLARRVAAALAGRTKDRTALMDELGEAGSDYRQGLYDRGFSGATLSLPSGELRALLSAAIARLDGVLEANRRPDGMFHAYNLMTRESSRVELRRLPLMLEGQVAALSSGILSPEEEAGLLEALRSSELYRPDQESYLLYPDRSLPSFLEKNRIPPALIEGSALAKALLERGGCGVLSMDAEGTAHFHASLRNARDLSAALDAAGAGGLGPVVASGRKELLEAYEKVFDHLSFTGRSGTFYKYEGLGCIYWHMVSKLLLAAGESASRAREAGAGEPTVRRLEAAYRDIRRGLGTHKSPSVYGAFPTDLYSHTPSFTGAQQPGMTGQAKEDLISRLAELGAAAREGSLRFAPSFAAEDEALAEDCRFEYVDARGEEASLVVPAGCYAFTVCQLPVVAHARPSSGPARVELTLAGGELRTSPGLSLGREDSASIFSRSLAFERIDVFF